MFTIKVIHRSAPSTNFRGLHTMRWGSATRMKSTAAQPHLIPADNILSQRNRALQELDIPMDIVTWPTSAVKGIDYKLKNPETMEKMYGENDLSRLPIFGGNFINFGFWDMVDLNSTRLTSADRRRSSERMYEVIAERAGVNPGSVILDVGCGPGAGCAHLSERLNVAHVTGLDVNPAQVERARQFYLSAPGPRIGGRLDYQVGAAERMPFAPNQFTNVISVEAAQHFKSIPDFIEEVSRVLRPGGMLAFTSFFAKNKGAVESLKAIIPDHHMHCSTATIGEVVEILNNHMLDVDMQSVGPEVWSGLEKWLVHIDYQEQWTKLWAELYKKGILDYVTFTGRKPGNSVESCQHSTLPTA